MRTLFQPEERGVNKEFSAGAVIFKRKDNGILFLAVCSARNKIWGFPKGHLDPGETEKEAATREIKEETNLSVKKPKLVYSTIEGNTFVYVFIAKTNNTVETKKITADFKIHLKTRNIFCLKDVFFAILNVAQNSFCVLLIKSPNSQTEV